MRILSSNRQARTERHYEAYAEQRSLLDELIDEAWAIQDEQRLELMRERLDVLNKQAPRLALTYTYGANRQTIHTINRYETPPHRPVPRIRFLPAEAVTFLESPRGVGTVITWAGVFGETQKLLQQYHKEYLVTHSKPDDWVDFEKVVNAQHKSINALGQRLCALAAVELPAELDDY